MIPAGGGEGGSSSANLADLPVIGFSQVANMLEEKLFFGHVGVSNQLDGHGNQVGPDRQLKKESQNKTKIRDNYMNCHTHVHNAY